MEVEWKSRIKVALTSQALFDILVANSVIKQSTLNYLSFN